jgi:hypothetical protein
LAAGNVEGLLLGRSSNGEFAVLHTYPNGDNLVDFTIMASSLPPGGSIKLEIWLGGRLFLDGTKTKTLRAQDFDEAGIAHVQMLLSSGVGTSCHRAYVYDAAGHLVGQM